jgi:hypothetical protein
VSADLIENSEPSITGVIRPRTPEEVVSPSPARVLEHRARVGI